MRGFFNTPLLEAHRWQRWSWNEIYLALKHEEGQGEAFVISQDLVSAPQASGAWVAPADHRAYDYCFQGDPGHELYVRDLGDRYAAFLEETGPRVVGPLEDLHPERELSTPLMAAAGGFLVFLGSLWAILETTLIAA